MELRDLNREWYTVYHKEAATTNDIHLARELYEARIKDLEAFIASKFEIHKLS